jgi:hypothetical protein
MADALDEQRILNVSIVENPTVPSLPTGDRWKYGLVGILLAATLSAGVVFTVEYLDPSLRTPSEVMSELNIPVLAAVPQRGGRSGYNGQGSVPYGHVSAAMVATHGASGEDDLS